MLQNHLRKYPGFVKLTCQRHGVGGRCRGSLKRLASYMPRDKIRSTLSLPQFRYRCAASRNPTSGTKSRQTPHQLTFRSHSTVRNSVIRRRNPPLTLRQNQSKWSRSARPTVVTRRVVATSSPSAAPTARDAHPRTRRSRDSPSATWSSPPPSVRFALAAQCSNSSHHENHIEMQMANTS
jgi:hypothetical protein